MSFFRERVSKSAKVRFCDEGGRKIEVGQPYSQRAFVDAHGEFGTNAFCLRCALLVDQAVKFLGLDDGFVLGEIRNELLECGIEDPDAWAEQQRDARASA